MSEKNTKEKLEALLKELELSTQVYMSALIDYRQQINAVNIYISFLGGFLILLFTNLDKVAASPNLVSRLLMMILPISILTINYFGSHIMDVVTNIYLLEARNNATERKINALIGKTLIWDSEFIPFYNRTFQQHGGWLNSSYTLGLWIFLIITASLVIHIILAFSLVSNLLYIYIFTTSAIFSTSFTIIQYVLLQWTGAKFIERMVLKMSGFKVKEEKTPTNLLIIPIMTFVFGFLSFAMISLSEGSFWLGGNYDIPLIIVPTIIIGDAIFLPVINLKIAKLVIDGLRIEGLKSRYLPIIVTVAFLSSIAMSGFSHWAWATDQYTDHISSVYGELSLGGWWHLIFSIAQTFVLFFFPYLWKRVVDNGNPELEKQCMQIWWWTLGFSSLMMVNYTLQFIVGVYGNVSVSQALLDAKFTFFPSLISLIILLTIKVYKKSVEKNSKKRILAR